MLEPPAIRVLDVAEPEVIARLGEEISAVDFDATAIRDGRIDIARRIDAREPDAWPGKLDLIDHARALAPVIPALPGLDLVVGTQARAPEMIAARIRDALAAAGMLAS